MKNSTLTKAEEFYNNGNIDDALNAYFEELFKGQTTGYLYMKIGHCNKLQGDNENAIEYYQKSLELEPDNPETLYNCGEAYFLQNELESALEYFQKITELPADKNSEIVILAKSKINEANSVLLNRQGGALMKAGQLDDAYEKFLCAIELNPNDKRNYANIGVIFIHKGDVDEAIKWMKKAIEADNNYVRGYYNLATLYLKQKQWYKQAMDLFTKALEIEPNGRDSADISNNLSVATDNYNEAECEMKKYLNGEIVSINNGEILALANNILSSEVQSIDISILNSGKYKFIAHGNDGSYSLFLKNNELTITGI